MVNQCWSGIYKCVFSMSEICKLGRSRDAVYTTSVVYRIVIGCQISGTIVVMKGEWLVL